jgi:hypothetical protein
MFFAGEFYHKIEAVFCWVRGGFYGFGLWEVEMLWVWVMGVTLVDILRSAPLLWTLVIPMNYSRKHLFSVSYLFLFFFFFRFTGLETGTASIRIRPGETVFAEQTFAGPVRDG